MRTLYYSRKRVSEHAIKTGENLYKVVFNQVTDEQIKKLGIKTDMQRMGSTQLLSNIADLSRLALLVEAIQRLHRVLSDEDKTIYAKHFTPYIQQSVGQSTYRIKGKEAVWMHIQQVGVVLHTLLGKMAEKYHHNPVQLVIHTQTAENRIADTIFLMEALPELKVRTDLDKMVTNGGYVSQAIDQAMREHKVEHITTALNGTLPDHQDGKIALSDFNMKLDQEGAVTQAVYPAGHSATIRRSAS